MSRYLVFAIGGAGGDLPPLIAAALALRDRGHDVLFLGDAAVDRALAGLGVKNAIVPAEFELGPRLIAAVKEAIAATGGEVTAAGPIVEDRLANWASEVGVLVRQTITELEPDVVVTSLFGVEAVEQAVPPCPWAVINSTFYVGPHPPRPIEEDIGPRAVPLIRRFAKLLSAAALVLHATDQTFDYSFTGLPPRHHYVGPLGLWEPQMEAPAYLDEPGDPWVLLSISSQLQDDLPLAEAALTAMADRPLRVLLTVGPDHQTNEISVRPGNARIEQVIPHSAVLRRGVLLISHAGHGSVMKALWEGVPMVLMPWGRDQPGVALRAHRLGVAEVVERGPGVESALGAAIDRSLSSAEMKAAAAAHAARLQSTSPVETAADLLEELAT